MVVVYMLSAGIRFGWPAALNMAPSPVFVDDREMTQREHSRIRYSHLCRVRTVGSIRAGSAAVKSGIVQVKKNGGVKYLPTFFFFSYFVAPQCVAGYILISQVIYARVVVIRELSDQRMVP